MPETDRKQRVSPRTDFLRNRATLLSAAHAVFASRGIDAPLDAIAKVAGLGNATLYRHFPTRKLLVAQVLADSLDRHRLAIDDALALERGWDGFTQYLGWLFEEQITDLSYMAGLREIPAGENAEIDAIRDSNMEGFTDLIERSKVAGDFRADRFLEDVLVILMANEQLTRLGVDLARVASRRFFELSLSMLSARDKPTTTEFPEDLAVLRRTIGQSLAGLPATDDA
jgi:AcrR family transcriptional regulator